jgi:hypothetical protein
MPSHGTGQSATVHLAGLAPPRNATRSMTARRNVIESPHIGEPTASGLLTSDGSVMVPTRYDEPAGGAHDGTHPRSFGDCQPQLETLRQDQTIEKVSKALPPSASFYTLLREPLPKASAKEPGCMDFQALSQCSEQQIAIPVHGFGDGLQYLDIAIHDVNEAAMLACTSSVQ